MASCNGCGEALGFKKYRFNKLWKIKGYYCKSCMMRVGENWEKYGRVTIPMVPCDLCRTEFYFLKAAWQGEKKGVFVVYVIELQLVEYYQTKIRVSATWEDAYFYDDLCWFRCINDGTWNGVYIGWNSSR